MDNRLFLAAKTGSVSVLHQLLQENPLILADFALISPHENPVHIATKAGHLVFVRDILTRKPELAREINQDGFRPIDIASSLGHAEIVREFLTIGPDICRMVGRDGRTAIHYAALYGRIEIIDKLLSACPESLKDVTILGETALHLAVKYYKIEALKKLIQWLQQLGLEELVNLRDNDGNTVLHLAVSKKQLESVELLLDSTNTISKLLELNAFNSKGLTAMDILDMLMESPVDVQLRQMLQHAGVLRTQNINTLSLAPPPQQVATISQQGPPDKFDWFNYFRFDLQRDSPSDTRNALLVIAALIATVTFQAGVNPPSSFVQGNSTTPASQAPTPSLPNRPHEDFPLLTYGLSAVSTNSALSTSSFFLLGNTLGLTASLSIIIYLTSGFPFQRELQLSIYSLMFAYGCSIRNVKPHGVLKYIFLGIAFFLPFVLRWPPRWIARAWKLWKQRSRDQIPKTQQSGWIARTWKLWKQRSRDHIPMTQQSGS